MATLPPILCKFPVYHSGNVFALCSEMEVGGAGQMSVWGRKGRLLVRALSPETTPCLHSWCSQVHPPLRPHQTLSLLFLRCIPSCSHRTFACALFPLECLRPSLPSTGVVCSGSIHVVGRAGTSVLFLAEGYFIMRMERVLCIRLCVDGRWVVSTFCLLRRVWPRTHVGRFLCGLTLSFLLGRRPGVEVLGCVETRSFTF